MIQGRFQPTKQTLRTFQKCEHGYAIYNLIKRNDRRMFVNLSNRSQMTSKCGKNKKVAQ